jgi:4-amino-4-deoxy-L-arabinose transferase-like glycosyltransferase
MLLGVVAFLLLLGGIVGFATIVGLHPPAYVPMAAMSLIPAALGIWVLVARFKRGPGLWVGLLIGVGILALAGGICAVMISQWKPESEGLRLVGR